MKYKPKPIDTSGVVLSREIARLSELLAKNAHEHWAQLEIAQGWHYGSHSDQTRRENPPTRIFRSHRKNLIVRSPPRQSKCCSPRGTPYSRRPSRQAQTKSLTRHLTRPSRSPGLRSFSQTLRRWISRSIEPEALLYHRFSGRLTLEGQLGDWHPIGGSAGVPAGPGSTTSEGFAGDIFTWGIGPSYKLMTRNRVTFTPVLEFVGWDVLSGFETLPGGPVNGLAREVSGTNIINVKIGARTSIGLHNSLYIGYGHALTSANWYDQIVRAEYRYVF